MSLVSHTKLEIVTRKISIPGPSAISPSNSTCQVCGAPEAHRHYCGLACSRCRVFFIRCSRLGKPFTCKAKGKCDLIPKTATNCPACRLQKCLSIGMKMEDVGVARRTVKPVVRYFEQWEKVMQINTVVSSLTVFGPKVISCLNGAKSATQYTKIYVNFYGLIDCLDGPSPSTTPSINLDVSIHDLLLNPLVCTGRNTAALDQIAILTGKEELDFSKSYGRMATSYADFITSIVEFHDLPDQDKVKLMQYNFTDYLALKSIYIKFSHEQNNEVLMEIFSKQNIDSTPPNFFTDVNQRMFGLSAKTVEKLFKEINFTESEFVLLVGIALFTTPVNFSDVGEDVAKRAKKRLTTILACYIEENFADLSKIEKEYRLSSILGTIIMFKEIAQLFSNGITQLVANGWGSMSGRLAVDLHLKGINYK